MRPRLLDLFCGAGGASVGYARAGFDVVGVDLRPMPRYPFEFHQADALTFPLDGFDAIHASPPCQAYSLANNIHGRGDHPQLIEPIRERLKASGVPYVIENVPGAPLDHPYLLCGLTFGLNVKRHRLFETPIPMLVPPCPPGHPGDWLLVFGHTVLERCKQSGRTAKNGHILRRKHVGTDRGRNAMGIDWMNRDELSEAIPPAYTSFIGEHLLAALNRSAA
jgi:DNA (cytosine-5)-methyltransferase 1